MGCCGGQPDIAKAPMKNKNIIVVQSLIRQLSEDSLKDPGIVADLIRAFGIVQWGPSVFGGDEVFKNHSPEMAGIYQTPCQLARALVYLSDEKIDSYLEVGIFQGGCFLFVSEYLKRFNPGISCLGIDPTSFLNPEVREIADASGFMKIAHITSDQIAGSKHDLVFIDGEHTGEWPERDWANVGKHARICLLHDIQETTCPEVVAFWEKLKAQKGYVTAEFLEHQSLIPLQGIGLLKRRERKSA